jgi:hypothetical protein
VGVSQGSIFGPFLCYVCMNNILWQKKCQIWCYLLTFIILHKKHTKLGYTRQIKNVRATARHAIHLQFVISVNTCELRVVQKPK